MRGGFPIGTHVRFSPLGVSQMVLHFPPSWNLRLRKRRAKLWRGEIIGPPHKCPVGPGFARPAVCVKVRNINAGTGTGTVLQPDVLRHMDIRYLEPVPTAADIRRQGRKMRHPANLERAMAVSPALPSESGKTKKIMSYLHGGRRRTRRRRVMRGGFPIGTHVRFSPLGINMMGFYFSRRLPLELDPSQARLWRGEIIGPPHECPHTGTVCVKVRNLPSPTPRGRWWDHVLQPDVLRHIDIRYLEPVPTTADIRRQDRKIRHPANLERAMAVTPKLPIERSGMTKNIVSYLQGGRRRSRKHRTRRKRRRKRKTRRRRRR